MSDGKSSEPYDFTHMWDLKLKTANEKQADRNSQTRQHSGGSQREGEWEGGVKGEGGQIYGSGRRSDFGVKHNSTYT